MSKTNFIYTNSSLVMKDRRCHSLSKYFPNTYDRCVQHSYNIYYGYIKPYDDLNIIYKCEENYWFKNLFPNLTKKEIPPYFALAINKHINDNKIYELDEKEEIMFQVYYNRLFDVIIYNPNDNTYETYKICDNIVPASEIVDYLYYTYKEEKETKLNNDRISCLLFYIQVYGLGTYGCPYFNDPLFYSTDMKRINVDYLYRNSKYKNTKPFIRKDTESMINSVIDLMDNYTSAYLKDMIKQDIEVMGYNTDEPNTNIELDYDIMRKYFAKYVEDTKKKKKKVVEKYFSTTFFFYCYFIIRVL